MARQYAMTKHAPRTAEETPAAIRLPWWIAVPLCAAVAWCVQLLAVVLFGDWARRPRVFVLAVALFLGSRVVQVLGRWWNARVPDEGKAG